MFVQNSERAKLLTRNWYYCKYRNSPIFTIGTKVACATSYGGVGQILWPIWQKNSCLQYEKLYVYIKYVLSNFFNTIFIIIIQFWLDYLRYLLQSSYWPGFQHDGYIWGRGIWHDILNEDFKWWASNVFIRYGPPMPSICFDGMFSPLLSVVRWWLSLYMGWLAMCTGWCHKQRNIYGDLIIVSN